MHEYILFLGSDQLIIYTGTAYSLESQNQGTSIEDSRFLTVVLSCLRYHTVKSPDVTLVHWNPQKKNVVPNYSFVTLNNFSFNK